MKWHHVGIQVWKLEESIPFYKNNFGFEIDHTLLLHGEKIAFLIKDEIRIELVESEDSPAPKSSVHFSWQVEDTEDLMKKLGEKGLNPIEGPYSLDNGWTVVYYNGPNNEMIEFIQISV
jgi:lactoylglutathione lyase